MTKKPAQAYHHGNLRAEILALAERALEAGGSGELSLRGLSRELGVSHTAPRRHFADKQALLAALAEDGYVRLKQALATASRARGQPFDLTLRNVGRAYVAFALRHPALLELMVQAKHRPEAPATLRCAFDDAFEPVMACVLEGQAAGAVVPGHPKAVALATFAAIQGLLVIADDGRIDGVPLTKLVDQIVERTILGMRPRN